MPKKGRNESKTIGKLGFLEMETKDKRPDIAVYVVDRAFKVLETRKVNGKGEFELPTKARDDNFLVVLGPSVDDLSKLDRKKLTVFRASQFKELIDAGRTLEVPKKYWLQWLEIQFCATGSVKHCYPWPMLIQQLQKQTLAPLTQLSGQMITPMGSIGNKTLDWEIAKPLTEPKFPHKCDTVCDGLVEVYRRNCCCWPWVICDPRLPQLIQELERHIEEIPEIPWPPEPDPGPYREIHFFKDGALDKMALNARNDLMALNSLSASEIPEYINARKYLCCCCCCCCTPPTKVAEGFIHPDGEFHICWTEPLRLMLFNCHDEYAFKVRQNIDGNTITIYDGVASGQWFDYGEDAELVSHHPDAHGCRHEEVPGDGAFALLQDIGLTGSYHLKTPDATGWDRVATPTDYNHGLAKPATSQTAAKGKYLDMNWGGTLSLRYYFSELMKDENAKYYRVSVVKADANGNPTGSRKYLPVNSWKYYEIIGADIFVKKTALGPHNIGTISNLYEIPYDTDEIWQSGQYHAVLDTTKFANGRFLLTLEVFNAAGMLLRPTGTPNPGTSSQENFTFRRWYQETGPMANVPYAALTHMLWWDNRKAVAVIEDFRISGSASTDECQFRSGSASDLFSSGYRAYHHEPMFLLNHRLWWRRGMGSPYAWGHLSVPSYNPDNVGVPPALPHVSGTETLQNMLGTTHTKCTFTMNLHVNVKTFNGIGILDNLDAWDQGSFALEIT